VASGCLGQFQGDPSLAKILQEQRFNAGGGKFGSAFAQEDGVVFREESSGNNNRCRFYTMKYLPSFQPIRGGNFSHDSYKNKFKGTVQRKLRGVEYYINKKVFFSH
jgi:hypothetical protein